MSNGQPINWPQLKRARLRKGWTLREAADRCAELQMPVDFATLSRLERGLTEPTPKTLLALSLALDITVDDLLDGAAA